MGRPKDEVTKPHSMTIRLTNEQYTRLHEATRIGPYAIPLTEIVTRGIELAAQELERMASNVGGDRS